MTTLQDLNTLFEEVWKGRRISPDEHGYAFSSTAVPTDMYVNNDTKDVAFQLALAGYSKEDITLTTEGDHLILEIPSQTEEKEESSLENFTRVIHGIRRRGVRQRFYVPQSRYSTEDIEAYFEDGILTIIVRARESEHRKEISIQ